MRDEVDGRLDAAIDDERVAVERDERRREHRPHQLPDRGAQVALSGGKSVASLRAMPSVSSASVRVTPAWSSTNAAAQRAVSCAMPRR
jgi:hypothetical protein